MSLLHLVFGGRVRDPQTTDFDPATIEVVGIFPDYAAAEKAWRAAAQRTVDDAEMKYVVVHLHRLLEPSLTPTMGSGPSTLSLQGRGTGAQRQGEGMSGSTPHPDR